MAGKLFEESIGNNIFQYSKIFMLLSGGVLFLNTHLF
jgi:hypothetical protein